MNRLGVVVNRVPGAEAVMAAAARAEELGFGAAWLTSGGPEDCMPLLTALALGTHDLRLGTSVVQTYPRHPYVLATEANVVDQLAPGRVRIGVGPSHDAVMASLGIERRAPVKHLEEYVSVLRSLLQDGEVSFSGDHFDVQARIGRRCAVPVMVGALQPRTFELAGAMADGAITWLCPAKYLADEAIPRLEAAAGAAGRDRPLVIAHIAVCVHEDPGEVRTAVREGIPNVRFPGYQRMLVTAGFPEASGGRWTDELIDGVIAWGSADHVASRITDLFEAGADEVLVRPIPAGPDANKVTATTLEAISAAFQG